MITLTETVLRDAWAGFHPAPCGPCHGTGQMLIEFHTARKPYLKDCPMCMGLGSRDLMWVKYRVDHIVLAKFPAATFLTACEATVAGKAVHFMPERRCHRCMLEVKLWGRKKAA